MLKQKRLLGWMGVLGFSALATLLTGCPSMPEPPAAGPPPHVGMVTPPPGNPAGGKICKGDSECGAGQTCDFGPGCGPGVCAAPHPCTRDLVPYCGCDGQTFRGSGNCPSRPFARKGGC